jgi:Mg2+ and Co2+ transporter CorA
MIAKMLNLQVDALEDTLVKKFQFDDKSMSLTGKLDKQILELMECGEALQDIIAETAKFNAMKRVYALTLEFTDELRYKY